MENKVNHHNSIWAGVCQKITVLTCEQLLLKTSHLTWKRERTSFIKEVAQTHVSSTCCSFADRSDSACWNIIQMLLASVILRVVFRALVIYFGRTRSSVKLPSHLQRTGLGNVPRDEFPQSVLNSTHRAGPPPLRAWPMARGRGHSVKQAQLYCLCKFVCLINVNRTQCGSNGEQFDTNWPMTRSVLINK